MGVEQISFWWSLVFFIVVCIQTLKCGHLTSRCLKLEELKLTPLDNKYCTERKIFIYLTEKPYLEFQLFLLVNSVTRWLNFWWDHSLYWEQPAVFNSWETFWFPALKFWRSLIPKMILYACVAQNYTDIFHGQFPKMRKSYFCFVSTKEVGFDFLLFQLVVIYMCAKNRTLASQNSWLYAAQICQISCTEHETTPLLFWFFSRVSLWLHLHFCHMVPCSLSCSMSPCPNAALPGWGSTDQLHTHCESINK